MLTSGDAFMSNPQTSRDHLPVMSKAVCKRSSPHMEFRYMTLRNLSIFPPTEFPADRKTTFEWKEHGSEDKVLLKFKRRYVQQEFRDVAA